MQQQDWRGVLPAITTPFHTTLAIDHSRLAKHVAWLVANGCRGIVTLGSLGEAPTLTFDEQVRTLETCTRAVGNKAPVIAGIAASSTAQCVDLAKRAAAVGCSGLMVLPPYAYQGDWREMRAHFTAVISATELSCLLYNDPIAYGFDLSPGQMRELAEHENLHAVSQSSSDVRLVAAMQQSVGDRLAVLAGMGDAVLQSIATGAVGWIAGVVNALPIESMRLFEAGRGARTAEARALYEWFLPLLRLETEPKFVQLIKLVQAEVGQGNSVVRPPRLELEGDDLEQVRVLIRERLSCRPA